MDAEPAAAAAADGVEVGKRARDTAGGTGRCGGGAAPLPPSSAPFPNTAVEEEEAAAASTLGLNLPVAADAAAGGTATLVKIYEADATPGVLCLHGLLSVVGIVWRPAGGVPTVHALRVTRASVADVHPALPSPASPAAALKADASTAAAATLRGRVVDHLAGALGGDAVAATYLAAALSARVGGRTPTAVLGKLSLNLVLPAGGGGHGGGGGGNGACGAGAVTYAGIADAIAAVVPRLIRLAADIPHLNAAPLFAVKDYAANRLRAGPLQVAPGGVLAVDATGLSPGTLNAVGVRNVGALAQLAGAATVPVAFDYYTATVEADAPLVAVSRGGKALFPTDVVLHVCPTATGQEGVRRGALTDADLPAARAAMAAAAAGEWAFGIPDDVASIVERTGALRLLTRIHQAALIRVSR